MQRERTRGRYKKRSWKKPVASWIQPRFFLLAMTAVSLLSACTAGPNPPREATPLEKKGWQVFLGEHCFSSCHVLSVGEADPDVPKGFVPNLRRTPRRSRDWYLAYLIDPQAVLPWSPMPSYKYLSLDQLEALIAFLERLNEVAPPTPELVSEKTIPETPGGIPGYNVGRALYGTHCTGCHGVTGNGGGHVGHLLSPEPRDFTDVVWMSKQTDTYLFSVITNGKPNTAMPTFGNTLSPRERAQLLRYIRYFADPVDRERMELGFVFN
ncbi:MAG: c-type cytochrome [Candidatus Binatia bacterium]